MEDFIRKAEEVDLTEKAKEIGSAETPSPPEKIILEKVAREMGNIEKNF